MNSEKLHLFTDMLDDDDMFDSQPMSLPSTNSDSVPNTTTDVTTSRPLKGTGQYGEFRSTDEIDTKYRHVFSYPFFNLVQSKVIDDALYSDKSMVVCAPTGSGKTVIFEMAIVQLLMEMEDKNYTDDFKIIYMAPIKALCTERLTEWYPKFTKLGLLCIEVTGDTDVDFYQLKPYRIIITTPEKWDMLTRRWRDHRGLVEVTKLFLIDEVHILNDETRGPVLEAVVSRMKTIESSVQSTHRIEQLQKQYEGNQETSLNIPPPRIRFIAVSATVSNPEDVATWLGNSAKPAVVHKFGDEFRPVKLNRIVEGYPCPDGTSIFKFDIILNYKLWPIIQKYYHGKPTLIFCNTRKSVTLTAETLARELTVNFTPEQKTKLMTIVAAIKNKKLQSLIMSGIGCHHAGLVYEERLLIERAFRNRDLPILITTTTLAMGINLPAHLVIVKNTQQYVNGAYQEYSASTVLQMVGRAGRPQYDTDATAVIMTRQRDKARYQALVGGSEPLQSYLHKRLAENLNSEAALGTVCDVAQCVQWLRSTFLCVRATRDPRRYLGLQPAAPPHLITKKIEELCIKAMNGLASSGLITMDEASCIESTEAGRLMSIYYLDLETMKLIMKIDGTESLERLLCLVCESHELAAMHLRVDERRCLNTLNRSNATATIRFPMKGKISTRQMKVNCIIQAVLGCLPIPDPSLNQEALKIIRIADRICKCIVTYLSRPNLVTQQPQYYSAVLNSIILAKCIAAHLWENSPYLSKQLKGIGPTFSTLLATAGKVNFKQLEESHPRDLERIMNKGPPAGNVLQKQISLLPKYQLTLTTTDDNAVSIHLMLLNQVYLSENMEHLTAGENHKSFVIVGDSNNHLLLLTSFRDIDMINVYDGSITYEIKRKLNTEHKIFVHYISSNFVGLDVHSEYLFKNLETEYLAHIEAKKGVQKEQVTIANVFKERKKINKNDITNSKEKGKRDNVMTHKFNSLRQAVDVTSKDFKDNLNKSTIISNTTKYTFNADKHRTSKAINENNIEKVKCNNTASQILENVELSETGFENMNKDDVDNDNPIDDDQINTILKEIENEMFKNAHENDLPEITLNSISTGPQNKIHNNTVDKRINSTQFDNYNMETEMKSKSLKRFVKPNMYSIRNITKKRKPNNSKSNYSFIDILEKENNYSRSDEEHSMSNNNCTFTDSIKYRVNKYLDKLRNDMKQPDKSIEDLLENTQEKVTLNSQNSTKSPTLSKKDINNDPYVKNEESISDKIYEGKQLKDYVVENNHIEEKEIPNEMRKENVTISTKDDKDVTNVDKYCKLNKEKASEREIIEYNSNLIHKNEIIIERHKNNCFPCDVNDVLCNETDVSNSLIPFSHNTTETSIIEKQIAISNKSIMPNTALEIFDPFQDDKPNEFFFAFNSIPNVSCTSKEHSIASTNHYSPQEKEHYTSKLYKEVNSNWNKEYAENKYLFTKKTDICTEKYIIRKMKINLNISEVVMTNQFFFNDFEKHASNKYKEENKIIDIRIPYERELTTKLHTNIQNLKENNKTSKDAEKQKTYTFNEENSLQTEQIDVTDPIEKIKTSLKNYNNIDNILQKYSEKLRKNYVNTNDKIINNNKILNLDSSKIKSQIKAIKKSYRINDIHRIDAPLPKSLVNETHTPMKSNILPQIKIIEKKHIYCNENNDNININLESPLDFTLNDLNQSPPATLQPESPKHDFKIDLSMFDPKVLIHSMNKEMIIPPPTQFSNATQSSNRSILDTNNLNIDNNQTDHFDVSQQFEDDNDLMPELLQDENLFENYSMEMTPTEEIETWILPKEENLETRNFYQHNPLKTFTVMRKNSLKINNPKHNVPRDSKKRINILNQFRFTQKNKLKSKLK